MSSRPNNVRRFLAYVRPYRWRLVLSTVVGVVKYNLPVIFPWILKEVIDGLLSGKPSRTGLGFDQLMGLSVLLFGVYAALCHLRTYIADRLAQAMIFDVRSDLFRHLQRLPIEFFQRYQTGVISSRLVTDVNMAQNFVGLGATNVFMDLTSLASITVATFLMNGKLALIAYCTFPLYVVLHKALGSQMKKNAREARLRMDSIEGALHETVAGISEVKSFTFEGEETRRFLDRCRLYLEAVHENIRTHARALGVTALLTRIPPVLVIWIGGHLVLRNELTVGALMAFYAYLEMIYNPLNRLSELNIQLANSRAAIDRLFEFFDLEPETKYENAPPLTVVAGDIRFEGVLFGYRSDRPVFTGIDLSVPAGQRVALVGPSGAGKSTLMKLLIRFHEPQEGRITIDGRDIRGVSLQSLRSQIALVQQDLMLFSGTVEDNIRVGKAVATEEEIMVAAELANALSFIQELPEGFKTLIGERGVRLSGGQKQRIAIARAFLKNAPILVLDESTSNLDTLSEHLVYEALERLMEKRTTIIIAHRISTVIRADKIVVLDQGKIAQEGTHNELLREAGGLYSCLYHDTLVERDGALPSRLPTGVERPDMRSGPREPWAMTSGSLRRPQTK
ncbi:MAG: multidrug transporter ATP-binding protein [Deltaproteobacteria bacterium]|nr:multidrug transporter ATP-binding protein [Deltaproteobacteria bacterium]